MMEQARIERWEYVINTVALEYSRKFPAIEIRDIKQTLYQWFVEHPNKLDTWEKIGDKDAKNLIYRSLRNQALDYCNYWKAKSGGYEVSDLFFYAADMVEALLGPILRGEWGVVHKLNLGRPGRPSAPSEGGNLMAMMIEIDFALGKLSKDDRKLLFLRYAELMEFGNIGKELGIGTEDATRMRHKRVIRKLINKIGGFRPYRDYDDVSTEGKDSAGSTQSDSPYES